jgi:hypothetical protein
MQAAANTRAQLTTSSFINRKGTLRFPCPTAVCSSVAVFTHTTDVAHHWAADTSAAMPHQLWQPTYIRFARCFSHMCSVSSRMQHKACL